MPCAEPQRCVHLVAAALCPGALEFFWWPTVTGCIDYPFLHESWLLQAMGAMNKQMNLPALTKIMREFERQNERMEMTSEVMGDAIDDAFEVKLW